MHSLIQYCPVHALLIKQQTMNASRLIQSLELLQETHAIFRDLLFLELVYLAKSCMDSSVAMTAMGKLLYI